eukprot:gene548-590_t
MNAGIASSTAGYSSSKNLPASNMSAAEIHMVLDELALLIQYCCSYSNYLKQLCVGAETRTRGVSNNSSMDSVGKLSSNSNSVVVTVFKGATEFDKMVDELINRFYLEAEFWLMRASMKYLIASAATSCGPSHATASSVLPTSSNSGGISTGVAGASPSVMQSKDKDWFLVFSQQLDECFFVQQRCGQRAIATNNIQAAGAVLHFTSELISTDLLKLVTELVTSSAQHVGSVITEQVAAYQARISRGGGGDHTGGEGGAGTEAQRLVTQGFQSALSIASSIAIAGSESVSQAVTKKSGSAARDAANLSTISGLGGGVGVDASVLMGGVEGEEAEDPWNVTVFMASFNLAEVTARYVDRLSREMDGAGRAVFGCLTGADEVTATKKLAVCRDDFEAARRALLQTMRYGLEQLTSHAQTSMRDVLSFIFSAQAPLGGICLHLPDNQFDLQPALSLLPKALLAPFEMMLTICMTTLSDPNKELVVGLLAEACCERLERFISQSRFHFAGALKMEECVRALTALFSKHSAVSVRGRFARLREILLVLTSDLSSTASASPSGSNSDISLQIPSDSFVLLNLHEIKLFASLRLDINYNVGDQGASRNFNFE